VTAAQSAAGKPAAKVTAAGKPAEGSAASDNGATGVGGRRNYGKTRGQSQRRGTGHKRLLQ
jgi:hypothetical protein